MIDAKSQGRNPLRWLNEKGIHDPAARQKLMDALNARSKPPGAA